MASGDDIRGFVQRAQRGDRRAFGELVKRYQASVHRLVSRMITNPAIAAELCQDVFLRAHQAMAGFDESSPFEPWLLRIARNRVYDHLRRTRVQPVPADGVELDTISTGRMNPAVQLENRELGRRIEAAVDSMKPNYREALHLRLVSGFDFETIGQITGQSADAAKARFVRARLKLRELLSGEVSDR